MTVDEVSGTGVAVVGSINVDMTLHVASLPVAAETTFATRMERTLGGKGLNQALAASRLTNSALIGRVGEDTAGDWVLERLDAISGLDLSWLLRSSGATGSAVIVVDQAGENTIVVLGGVNSALDADHVVSALSALEPTVVLAQLEVPFPAVAAVRDWAAGAERRFVLNASPLQEDVMGLAADADPLVVNLGEARQLIGDQGSAPEDLAIALAALARSAIVTTGPDGSYLGASERVSHFPAPPVDAVDTTGAGDAFVGTLAASLSGGADPDEAVAVATAAAAEVVGRSRTEREA